MESRQQREDPEETSQWESDKQGPVADQSYEDPTETDGFEQGKQP